MLAPKRVPDYPNRKPGSRNGLALSLLRVTQRRRRLPISAGCPTRTSLQRVAIDEQRPASSTRSPTPSHDNSQCDRTSATLSASLEPPPSGSLARLRTPSRTLDRAVSRLESPAITGIDATDVSFTVKFTIVSRQTVRPTKNYEVPAVVGL